jgi:hypothetical protein
MDGRQQPPPWAVSFVKARVLLCVNGPDGDCFMKRYSAKKSRPLRGDGRGFGGGCGFFAR